MMPPEHKEAARTIWNYMLLNQEEQKSDVAIVMGARDLGMAERCAELWQTKLCTTFIFSGYRPYNLPVTEAEYLSEEAIRLGVPTSAIILEKEASNSAENLLLSYDIIKRQNIPHQNITLVCKPYMQRRAYALAKAQWPAESNFYITSQAISFDDYVTTHDPEWFISVMLGDLQRIKEYPKKGWQITQPIPDNVWHAYELLCNAKSPWQIREIKKEFFSTS